jgi:hypothetical protein
LDEVIQFSTAKKRLAVLNKLQLGVDACKLSYNPSSTLGKSFVVCLVNFNDSDWLNRLMSVGNAAKEDYFAQPAQRRAQRRELMQKLRYIAKLSSTQARAIFIELGVEDENNVPDATQRLLDVAALEDVEAIVVDRRSLRTNDTSFEQYFAIVERLMTEEEKAVDERRHGQQLFLPVASSIPDLMARVAQRIEEMKTAAVQDGKPLLEVNVPSASWLARQFLPRSTRTRAADNYTRRFDLRYAMQSRSLREVHDDSHYCATRWLYLKRYLMAHPGDVAVVSADDKAKIPIGEPTKAVAACSTQRRVLMLAGEGRPPSVLAMDHDYDVKCRLVPSVVLSIKPPRPDDDDQSFYHGRAYVSLKEGVHMPSCPAGHMVELLRVLNREHPAGLPPIVALFTDGGSDHRTTYRSVRLALISFFLHSGVDMVIAERCAPGQSYVNFAERPMASLNMALYGVAMARIEHPNEEIEGRIAKAGGLNDLRTSTTAEEIEHVSRPAIDMLGTRFEGQTYSGEHVRRFAPATHDERLGLLATLRRIDDGINVDDPEVFERPRVRAWLNEHARFRHYGIQIHKCATGCAACTARLRPALDLGFVPDPKLNTVPDSDGRYHYYPYEEMVQEGVEDANELERPSNRKAEKRPARASGATIDQHRVDYFTAEYHTDAFAWQKIVATIKCGSCGRSRAVFGTHAPTAIEAATLANILADVVDKFICGDNVCPPHHAFFHQLPATDTQHSEAAVAQPSSASAATNDPANTPSSSSNPEVGVALPAQPAPIASQAATADRNEDAAPKRPSAAAEAPAPHKRTRAGSSRSGIPFAIYVRLANKCTSRMEEGVYKFLMRDAHEHDPLPKTLRNLHADSKQMLPVPPCLFCGSAVPNSLLTRQRENIQRLNECLLYPMCHGCEKKGCEFELVKYSKEQLRKEKEEMRKKKHV